jgi:hypothetical protein
MRLPLNVYEEYKQRRNGIIRALTADVRHSHRIYGSVSLPGDALWQIRHQQAVFSSTLLLCCCCAGRRGLPACGCVQVEKLYAQCDPERENLCLYGLPDGTWAVDLPAEEVPPEIPEPALGINFARDGMTVSERWMNLRDAGHCTTQHSSRQRPGHQRALCGTPGARLSSGLHKLKQGLPLGFTHFTCCLLCCAASLLLLLACSARTGWHWWQCTQTAGCCRWRFTRARVSTGSSGEGHSVQLHADCSCTRTALPTQAAARLGSPDRSTKAAAAAVLHTLRLASSS